MNDEQTTQPTAEPPDMLTLTRLAFDEAVRRFRKAAGGLQFSNLVAAAEAYQEAQFQASIAAEKIKFGRQ